MASEERLVSAAELARHLGRHRETIYRYVRDGMIPVALRLPDGDLRFRVSEVEAALHRLEIEADDQGTQVGG